MADLTYADVDAGVRRAIAAYTQALDDGRTDDVVATFCADGGIDIAGLGTHEGHDALRAAYATVEPQRPQRHLVLNTLITDWSATSAAAHAATSSSSCSARTAGRRCWSVGTTTCSTRPTTAPGASTTGRPSSRPDAEVPPNFGLTATQTWG